MRSSAGTGRVEKASGEVVTLGEYLEQVWAAVSKEALSLLFKDADASGLEPDARLTAMWLWTLGGGAGVQSCDDKGRRGPRPPMAMRRMTRRTTTRSPASRRASGKTSAGYELEFDAARKIAQGLGAHLDKLSTVVEVKGDKARLLSVSERTRHLFGKDAEAGEPRGRRKKKDPQLGLFAELEAAEEMAESGGWALGGMPMGQTALDRIHQAMILFAAGRGEALKRFLVEDGAGNDARFWKLAQFRFPPCIPPAPTRNAGSMVFSAGRKDWGSDMPARVPRKLSGIVKELAESIMRDPRAVPSSETAHMALLLTHVAWNRVLGQPLPEAQYRTDAGRVGADESRALERARG